MRVRKVRLEGDWVLKRRHMFKEIGTITWKKVRIIYHQTTPYSNPIIETVLYQNKARIFYSAI